ncbi:TPA: tRNA uridine-5-carboxymethylaminomethyl(34) synthesis GTPase MnmE [Legionella pneumophila]|uniref:tRNA uridine-5-carboxymethylaminomethyl(34) synthesis GTPase MnmE n=1 Tax=Legionella pneumophila TaxID=446 RepID=UPI000D05EDFE|nr:tRNA uridine-5-carboxymethylaminomethyl(34) synthesis GTPase MnmE [Legionella pneumophila]HAT1922577.1 tRNA uridine-5-carboxymethylaminomethyl(34) synthesis GTPase MnmE [Legionella pneumophila]HAT7768372.1 tRNA uridine-5-carboxymethylaminomethyl(34) synthesis GTPase MnmE [Legionella pneumophila]HAU1573575.1 tRNA uridine-5-carboxymethylaminomethyl(34) synthesis GTPase MnmE [Legionella pneumophila]HAU1605918.1 tRNA uridine-5-carboxymethylaminomethyl(34) synthesis GTPase MnmE [Legionella pneumo
MSVDTIVAIATPPGRGGVGIVRISGPNAYAIALCLNGNKALQPRLATFCSLYKANNEVLDQGLVLYFKGPHSFTGEDVIEIQAHGSPVVLDLLVKESIAAGARLARPGEFSERAFLNDKIDLIQAEAIADLIQASSDTAARMALKSLQGDFSKKINQLNEELIYLRMYVEAAIDFPEEEIDFLNDGNVSRLLQRIIEQLEEIRSQANQGVLLREGLSLVIAGRPNAGKSTLINNLAGRDIAIVTEIAGTTRDVMREHILLDDIPLHIIDTAGLRDSDDLVEKEGIKRAWQELKRADCVLLVVDINNPDQQNSLLNELKLTLPNKVPIITVYNKIDTTKFSAKCDRQTVYLSAKTGEGMSELKKVIKQVVGYQPAEGQFLARRRHLQALDEAKTLLLNGQAQLTNHKAGELLAEDLRLAHQMLCEITGEFTSDDLLGKIFSSFCIGK